MASAAVTKMIDRVPASVASVFRPESRAARLARPLVDRLLPAGIEEVTIRGGRAAGLRIAIEPRHEKYYWTGTYEEPVQEELVRLLAAGGTYWDVGAHAGFFTLLAARTVGARGHVHAFEPMSANRARLDATIRANGLANVTVHAEAVAGEPGGARQLLGHASTSMWSLVPDGAAAAGDGRRSETIACRTLDSLAAEIGPPTVVKLDVEGAEVDALRGGERLLRERRPTLLLEFSSAAHHRAAMPLLAGYRLRSLGPRHDVAEAA